MRALVIQKPGEALIYPNRGKCASCLRGRPNTCQFNETLGVQRDGALLEKIWMHAIVPLDQAPVILKQWSESLQRFTKIMVSLD